MKTIVIFKSKTGFVKQYAEWIAEELSGDLYEASKVTAERLTSYDTIIYGGGLYAGGINGLKLITQNLKQLKDKKILVFGTGASSPKKIVIEEVNNKNLTAEQQKQVQFFYLRGGFDYSKLSFIDRMLMNMMKRQLKKKDPSKLTDDDKGMLDAFDHPVSFVKKENINELISAAAETV